MTPELSSSSPSPVKSSASPVVPPLQIPHASLQQNTAAAAQTPYQVGERYSMVSSRATSSMVNTTSQSLAARNMPSGSLASQYQDVWTQQAMPGWAQQQLPLQYHDISTSRAEQPPTSRPPAQFHDISTARAQPPTSRDPQSVVWADARPTSQTSLYSIYGGATSAISGQGT